MKVTVKGNKLVIEVDLEAGQALSSSGKSMLFVDSMGGAEKVAYNGEVIKVQVNAYTPVKQQAQ